MDETSLSLLTRLKNSQDAETWERLVSLYAPLLKSWLRKYNVASSDVDDLMQDVLLACAKRANAGGVDRRLA
jgi:RNA polymerase sigma-70 factor (ECF subfamily)